jgi:Domain of unknown function (DUF4388)
MDNQGGGTADSSGDLYSEPRGSTFVAGVDRMPDPDVPPLFGSPNGAEAGMSQSDSSEEDPAASLVGSLSVFTLSDVLTMLASTAQTGELEVVSEMADGRVWLDGGELSNAQVGEATTIGQAVFELACVSDGWFYFTTDLLSASEHPPVPVGAVLDEVRPQVDEWREIRQVVPLEAVVTLASDPPGQDVQIRSDQWRVLTTVGNSGHTVRSVIEMIGGDQIVGLRTLRDLHVSGLIEFATADGELADGAGAAPNGYPGDTGSVISALPTPPPSGGVEESPMEDLAAALPPTDLDSAVDGGEDGFSGLAEVAMMPPPIAGDPWTPTTESDASSDNGVA